MRRFICSGSLGELPPDGAKACERASGYRREKVSQSLMDEMWLIPGLKLEDRKRQILP